MTKPQTSIQSLASVRYKSQGTRNIVGGHRPEFIGFSRACKFNCHLYWIPWLVFDCIDILHIADALTGQANYSAAQTQMETIGACLPNTVSVTVPPIVSSFLRLRILQRLIPNRQMEAFS